MILVGVPRDVLRACVLALLMLPVVTFSSGVIAEESVVGQWEVTMSFGGRDSFATLSIAKKPDGTLTGKWLRDDLSKVKFDGGKLTFVRTMRFGDNEFSMDYTGTLKDGKLQGSFSTDQGEFAANAVRKKPKSPVLGRWNLNFTVRDRDIKAVLAVTEKPGGLLDAQWTSDVGEHVVSEVKFKDGQLSFARESEFGDFELKSTYTGKVSSNRLAGTIRSDLGEYAASGEREGAKLIGEWELTSNTDRGPRRSALTIYGDLTGRYEFFGSEIPIKDLKLEGDQVAFSVELGFGDRSFNMDFKGKLDGTTLKGELETQRGKREVTGKKVTRAAAFVGTWEIERETPNGTRTFTLTFKEDMTGTFTARDNTVKLEGLKVEGDQLSFKATLKFGERDVPIEFKGKVDGTTLKGEFITPRGAREAIGKKVKP